MSDGKIVIALLELGIQVTSVINSGGPGQDDLCDRWGNIALEDLESGQEEVSSKSFVDGGTSVVSWLSEDDLEALAMQEEESFGTSHQILMVPAPMASNWVLKKVMEFSIGIFLQRVGGWSRSAVQRNREPQKLEPLTWRGWATGEICWKLGQRFVEIGNFHQL